MHLHCFLLLGRQATFPPNAKQRFHQAPSSFSTKRQAAFPLSAKLSAKLMLHQAPSSVSTKRQAHFALSAKATFQPSAKLILHQAPSS
eukprot:7609088-Karenia_brevis.AAC.1